MAEQARELFTQLEAGNENLQNDWRKIRETAVKALQNVYAKLGIEFDYYHGEAMYGDLKVSINFNKQD